MEEIIVIQIKHFTDYLYSGEKDVPCAEHYANEWLKKHPGIVVKDVQTQITVRSKHHEEDELHITIVYEVPEERNK